MKFKKFISKFLCLSIIANAICLNKLPIPNNVDASTENLYMAGDIDDNGVLDLTDLTLVSLYLSGALEVNGTTAERLDVNRDYIIDLIDYDIVMSYVMGAISHPVGSVNTDSLPMQEHRLYNVYDASTGYQEYSYYIYRDEDVNSRAILDFSDDRNEEAGFNGVLKVENSSGDLLGTAFVVDNHTILTAAHVLHPGIVNSNICFKVYDANNNPLNVSITPLKYHIPNAFTSIPYDSHYANPYDYAIVTVSENLRNYKNFNLGTIRSHNISKSIYVTGYGADDPYVNSSLIGIKSTGVGGMITNNSFDNDKFICYDTDMVRGDSGGPVYTSETRNNKIYKTAIGINIYQWYTCNVGIRITKDILKFIYRNTNL